MLIGWAAAVKPTGQKAERGGAAPGRLWAAQNVWDILPAAVGERVDASSELPRDLVGRRAQTTVSALSGRGFQDISCHKHLTTFWERHQADLGSLSHLLVGGSASGHQNNVETSESSHWDEEQAGYAHDSQSEEPQSSPAEEERNLNQKLMLKLNSEPYLV